VRIEHAHGDQAAPAQREIAALLNVDPDLGHSLSAEQWETARHELPVRIVRVERGPWAHGSDGTSAGGHLGLLIVDGLVGRELLADDVASMELLGPGDLLRPGDEATDVALLRATVRWSALARTRFALLDRQLARRLAAYPQIHGALLERATARTRRRAVLQAISHLTRVDRRLLTLFWHLAERWGRVTPNGVLLPLTLSHRCSDSLSAPAVRPSRPRSERSSAPARSGARQMARGS
jgi:CRP/FNR family transcriptional regulator, cyclic AMP receptor protein